MSKPIKFSDAFERTGGPYRSAPPVPKAPVDWFPWFARGISLWCVAGYLTGELWEPGVGGGRQLLVVLGSVAVGYALGKCDPWGRRRMER